MEKPGLVRMKINIRSRFWREKSLLIGGLTGLLLGLSCQAPEKVTRDRNLNVLLITLDTTRADRIGCYGYSAAKTPAIDALAAEGVRFVNAYCQVPLTLPSHCSLMTGKYPVELGVHNNGFYFLSPDFVTLAERLKEGGYRTAAFVGSFTVDSRFGLDQGFEVYDDQFSKLSALKNFREERSAEAVFDAFSRWLEDNSHEKFFSWVHFFDPHSPYLPPSPYKEEFAHNLYDGEIAYMDAHIGKIRNLLEQKKILDKTLVVLAGDHGEAFGEKGEVDHGLFLYDSTIKVPLIFYAPNRLPRGVVVDSRVRLIDVMPTVLDMVKLKVESGSPGKSLLPHLSGQRRADLPSYLETYAPRETFGWSELLGWIDGDWKYIQAPKPELYNLKSDPVEERNVIDEEKRISKDMKKELDAFLKKFFFAERRGARRLTKEEEARLRSLGYLSGEAKSGSPTRPLPDPKDKNGEFRLYFEAKQLESQGDFVAAGQIYERLIQSSPEAPWNYVYLALTLEKRDLMEEAIQTLEKGLERNPGSIILLSRLNFFYLAAGNAQKALDTCRIILDIYPRDFDALFISGSAMWRTHQYEKAASFFEKALEIEPENSVLRFRYANCLASLGRTEEALKLYQRLQQEFPEDYRIHHEMGLAFSATGDLVKAREHFQRAVELYPSDVTYLNFAIILEKMGSLEEAIRYLKLYLEASPEDTPQKRRVQRTLVEWEKRLLKR